MEEVGPAPRERMRRGVQLNTYALSPRSSQQWVTQAHDAMIKYGFTRSLVEQAVRMSNLKTREGLHDLFDALNARGVSDGAESLE
jgi:hypothetical protein